MGREVWSILLQNKCFPRYLAWLMWTRFHQHRGQILFYHILPHVITLPLTRPQIQRQGKLNKWLWQKHPSREWTKAKNPIPILISYLSTSLTGGQVKEAQLTQFIRTLENKNLSRFLKNVKKKLSPPPWQHTVALLLALFSALLFPSGSKDDHSMSRLTFQQLSNSGRKRHPLFQGLRQKS